MSDLTMDILGSEKLQRVLRALRDGVLESIDPCLGFDSGVEYPALRDFFDSVREANDALLLLSEAGLLRSEIVDNIVVCPLCQSHKLVVKMRCPSCNSSKLVRGAMIEHLACGHIDFEEKFRGGEGLICPRCGKKLDRLGLDYRTFSSLYRCLDCRSVFSDPRVEYSCVNGHSFGEGDIAIQVVKSFRLNPEKKALLERLTLDLEAIFKPLRAEGFIVEAPAKVHGETGVKHDFSFAIWDCVESKNCGEAPVAVGSMHTSDSIVTATDVLAFWAKALDAGAKHKFMVAFGGVDESSRDLARVYGINIIEGRNAADVIVKAKAAIVGALESARKENPLKGALQNCSEAAKKAMLAP